MAYTTIARVRSFMGAFGRPKTTEVVLNDVFSSIANFTTKVGSFTTSANQLVVTATTATAVILANNISTTTETITVKLSTSTQAGIVFGATTSASNYQSVLIDVANNNIEVATVSTGSAATSQISFTGTFQPSTFYTLRVEVSGQTAVVYVDGTRQTDVSGLTFTNGGVGLVAISNTATAYFQQFQCTIDDLYLDDSTISTAIQFSDRMIERRTQKFFSTNLASNELYDWFDQAAQEMPYILSRSFNTLPTFYRLQGFGDMNNILVTRNHPIYSTVKLEENEAADGQADSWKTRTQGRNADYVVYGDTGVIAWVANFPRNGHQNIRLNYSYGSTAVADEIAQLSTRYAIREVLVGFGSKIDGLENFKKENNLQIAWLEEFIPRATLMASVSKTTERIT